MMKYLMKNKCTTDYYKDPSTESFSVILQQILLHKVNSSKHIINFHLHSYLLNLYQETLILLKCNILLGRLLKII